MTFKGRCVECGEIKNVFYHHTDYSPDNEVAVCHSCHRQIHYGKSKTRDPTNGKHRRAWLADKTLPGPNKTLDDYET